MRKLLLALCLSIGGLAVQAQSTAPGNSWQRLRALPTGTRMHVSGDRMSRTCVLDAVTDDQITCSRARVVNTAHYTFSRGEVRSVKLTRYTLSTLAGFGIGAGAGAAIAGAAFNRDSFKAVGVAVFGVGGGVLGALVTGPTDAFRGPLVYRR